MKISFNLLVLGNQQSESLKRLQSVCADTGVPTFISANSQSLTALPALQLAQQIIFIAGHCSAAELLTTVESFAAAGAVPVVIVDALSSDDNLVTALAHLAETRIQAGVVAQVKGLVKSSRLMFYQYAKADSTATIMVIIGSGTASAKVLTITRLHAPFKDCQSFPGGFLNAHIETLLNCGAREGSEETNVVVPPHALVLLDVRSSPQRDERGHVVDHGYMWLVPASMAAQVESSASAGDDAKPGSAAFVSVAQLLAGGTMAFDHYQLLLAAVRTGLVLPPKILALRFVRLCQRLLGGLADQLERRDSVFARYHK